MNDLCIRCGRRERYARLTVCEACASRLVGRTPEPVRELPEWRKRDLSRDWTGRAA